MPICISAAKRILPAILGILAVLGIVSIGTARVSRAESFPSFHEEKARWEEHFRNNVPDVKVKGSGWKPFNRWAWFHGQRVDESGFVPAGARWDAYQDMLRLKDEVGNRPNPVWTSHGPNNIAGRCQPIAIDPTNPNRMYVGAVSGGIWISTNAGTSWEPADDQLPTLAIGALLIDPTDPAIIYAGTGEGNNNADAIFGVGVLRSTDYGLTWAPFGTGMNWQIGDGKAINALAFNEDTETLIAATNTGTWRCSGGVWTSVNSGIATAVVRHPTVKTTFYVANGRTGGSALNGVYISTDDGLTWTEQTNGFPATHGRVGLAICDAQPGILYAGVSATSGSLLGIYKTTDGGTTWGLIYNANNHYSSQGWYDLVIAVDPTNPNKVYSGGVDIWVSTNGGTTFSHNTFWNRPPGNPQYVHADQHGWAFHPNNPSHVYAACDGGIFQSLDSGVNWTEISTGLTTMQFYDIDVAQNAVVRALGGTQDNGTNQFNNGNLVWDRDIGGDGFHCNIDWSNADVLYGEIYYGDHYRSTNGGVSYTPKNNGIGGEQGAWDTPVHMDYFNSNILYTAHRKIFKTTNRMDNWVAKTAQLPGSGTTIAQSLSDANILYCGYNSVRNIHLSTDRGETWAQVSATGLPNRSLTRLRVHPTTPGTVFATYSGYSTDNVWKSTDLGATWTSVGGNLPAVPCNALEIDPLNADIIYVGTDIGVFRTEDGGVNWLPYGTGLPAVVIGDLRIQRAERLLYAGTYGRGLWSTDLTDAGSSEVQESDVAGGALGIAEISPNPITSGNINVRFTLPSSGRVKVQLFDVSGRLIETSFDGQLGAGTHRVDWKTGAPAGNYFVRVRLDNDAVSSKVTVQG